MSRRFILALGIVALAVLLPGGARVEDRRKNNLDELWIRLLDNNSERAFQAMVQLRAQPEAAADLLGRQLRPVAPLAPEHVKRLIDELGDSSFKIRERAHIELAKLAERVETPLRQAAQVAEELEVRRRAKAILQQVDSSVYSGDRLRVLRALEVLEWLELPDAEAVLKKLAGGADDALETRRARAALERRQRRRRQEAREAPRDAAATPRLLMDHEQELFPEGRVEGTPVFSADGRLLVTVEMGRVHLWQWPERKKLKEFRTSAGRVPQAILTPDGKVLAACDGSRGVWLWRVESGEEIRALHDVDEFISAIDFSTDGRTLLASAPAALLLWDWQQGRELRRLEEGPGLKDDLVGTLARRLLAELDRHLPRRRRTALAAAQFSPRMPRFLADGKTVFAGSVLVPLMLHHSPFIGCVWNVETGKLIHTWVGPSSDHFTLQFSADRKTLAVWTSFDMHLIDVRTGKTRHCFPSTCQGFRFTADGRAIVAGTTDGLALIDCQSGKELCAFADTKNYGQFSIFLPPGQNVFLSPRDGHTRAWSLATGKPLPPPGQEISKVEDLAFAPDGGLLVTTSKRNGLKLWSRDATGSWRAEAWSPAPSGLVDAVAFAAHGRVVVFRQEGKLHFWDLTARKQLHSLSAQGDGPIIMSPDGRLVAQTDANGGIQLRRASNGALIHAYTVSKAAHKDANGSFSTIPYCAFSADGNMLYTLGFGPVTYDAKANNIFVDGRMLHAWEVSTGAHRLRQHFTSGYFPASGRGVTAFTLAPDGRQIALSSGSTLHLCDAWTLTEQQRLGRATCLPYTAAYSADGSLLAMTQRDGSFSLWDARSGKMLRREAEATGSNSRFAPDGKTLARFRNGNVLLWELRKLRTPDPPRPARLSARDLQHCWRALADQDNHIAQQAMRRLIGAPEQTLALLATRLQLAPVVKAEDVDRLVHQFLSADRRQSEQAVVELEQLGDAGKERLETWLIQMYEDIYRLPHLRKTLLSREEYARLNWLNDQLMHSAEIVRQRRALEVLEEIDSRAARELLKSLGQGPTTLAAEARAALGRQELRQQRRP